MKKLLIVLSILLLTGCFSKPQPPKWVDNVPQDNNEYFYASAQAFTKEGAIKQALNDIASRLTVSISSELLINQGIFKNKAYNEMSHQINAKVSNIHFNNYEVMKYKKIENSAYVLLRVNKSKLKEQFKTDIQSNLLKINNILNRAMTPFDKVQSAYKVMKLIAKTKKQISILQTLNEQGKEYITKLTLFADKANEYLKTTFSVKVNKFKQITMDVMSKYFNIAKSSNPININVTLKKDFILKKYLIIGTANVNFISKSVIIRFKGSSYTDYQSAIFKAGQDYKQKLNTTIKNLLGI